MKTLRFLIFGLLVTAEICRAQVSDPGWYNNAQDGARTHSLPTDSSEMSYLGLIEDSQNQPNVPASPIAEVITPDIQALANGLQNNPLQIFNYVHDHVRHDIYFGSQKGAELTLLEKSGNDMDQCSLLIALLNAAGYTNTAYQFGWMELPLDNPDGSHNDLHHWLRLNLTSSNWTNNANYLDDLIYFTAGYPDDAAIWGTNIFGFQRTWVTLTIGSTNYLLDPSFKVSEPVTGINLTNVMGVSSNSLMSITGGTVTTNSVSGLNEAALQNALTGYTTNLLNYIQNNSSNASMQQIIGGWRIVPSTNTTLSQSLLFTTVNPNGHEPILTWNNAPTNLMTTLKVTFAGTNYQWFMPQLQGQRLTLLFDTNGTAQLWQEDSNLLQHATSGSSSTTNVVLYINHSIGDWDVTNNVFINDSMQDDENMTNSYQRTNATYILTYAFDPADWGWLQKRENQLENYRQQGLADTSRQVVSETLNIMGLNWILQTEGNEQILAAQDGTLAHYQHRLGRMAQELGRGYYIDIYMQISCDLSSAGDDTPNFNHELMHIALADTFNSASEHGVIEQLQNSNLVAASTVKMLEIASTNNQTIYLANSNNWTKGATVKNSLVHYDTATLNQLTTYINNQSYSVLLPQNGSNHVAGVGSWAGYGYYASSVTSTFINQIMAISGNYNGGYVSDPNSSPNISYVDLSGVNQPEYFADSPTSTPNPPTADPVDTADDTFQIEHTDLSLGQPEPRGITLSRYYNGTRRFSNTAGMADGWIHNYSVTANNVSAPQAGLGGMTPAQAASMMTATCAAIDIYNNTPNVKNLMLDVLIAKWASDQLTKSGVSVNLGKDTLQFVKQPNGVFTPPANCTMTLTQNGSSYSLQERHGNTFNFDSLGRLSTIVDQYSNTLSLTYTNNYVRTVSDWKGRSLTFTYTGSQLTSVADSTGRSVSYGYSTTNAQGDLTSFTDPESKTCTYSYDTNHQITATLNESSQLVVSNLYDVLGHVTTQYTQGDANKMWKMFWSSWQTVEQDPAGSQQVYSYDDQSRLISLKDALGNLTQSFYDGQNHIVATVSPLNETNQFIYDGNNNLIASIDPLGFTNQFVYDGNNNLIQTIDPRGNPSTFGYNSQFSLTGSTNGAGDFVNYAFNTDGTLHTRADSGGTTTYAYDSYGQLNSITYPGSLGSESFANNLFGDVTNHTDARGFTTTFSYNNRRQLTNSVAPTNLVARIAYDAVGNTASTTDPCGNVTSDSWSATRHLLSTTLPTTAAGTPIVTNFYDNRDLLVKTLDPLGRPAQFTNDIIGRLIAAADPLSRTTTFGFDANGHNIATTNAAGEVTAQQWDARGELIQLTDGAGHTVLRAYDGTGNQIMLTNRRVKVWQFKFDGANRLTNTTTPRGYSTSLTFNHQGLPVSMKDPAGHTNTYSYDAKGRLTSRADNVGTTTYNYDPNNNITNTSENGFTNSWTYDAYNRVTSCKDAYGNLIQYKYDANGNVTNLIYPGGKNVYYAFDSNNHMTNVTDWSGRKTGLTYDLDGRVTSITRPNGTYRTISYDAAGEATNILEQTALGFPIALFRYNWNNAAEAQWEFAAPLLHTNAPPTRTMTYDDDNRLATFKLGTSSTLTVGSDADGNLTNAPLMTNALVAYTYDARNRLQNAGGVTNGYDPAGNRVGIIYGTNSVSYVVNPNSKLSQVLMRAKNGVTNYYIYGAGLLYEVTETATATNTLTYHYDYRGSTIALSDGNGNVTDRIEYSLYATLTYRIGTSDTPFLFNGRYGVMTDPNGLLYMRARFYNPYLCRFLNSDPSGFSGGLNFFAYANGNPVSLTDPFGQWAVLDDLAFSGGGAVLGALGQGIADLVSGNWSWSGIGHATAAGAAGGEATLYGGPIVGAAVFAGAKNTLDQSAEMAATGNDFNYLQLGGQTFVGGVTGTVGEFIPMPAIFGLNAGQGSYQAVTAQMVTKLENGTIQNISLNTAGQMFVSQTYNGLSDTTLEGFTEGVGNSDGTSSTAVAPVWNFSGNQTSSIEKQH
jgi:RHS repeat-associated protein